MTFNVSMFRSDVAFVPAERIHRGLQCRRGRNHSRLVCGARNRSVQRRTQPLLQSLVVHKKGYDRAPSGRPDSFQTFSRKAGSRWSRWLPCVQLVIAEVFEHSTVPLVRPALRDKIHLRARAVSAFGVIQAGAHAKFGDRVQRNVEPEIGFLARSFTPVASTPSKVKLFSSRPRPLNERCSAVLHRYWSPRGPAQAVPTSCGRLKG